MPTTITAAHVTADELVTTALARLEQAMLHLCLLGEVLTSEQRHPIRNDLTAANAALHLHQRLYAEEVG